MDVKDKYINREDVETTSSMLNKTASKPVHKEEGIDTYRNKYKLAKDHWRLTTKQKLRPKVKDKKSGDLRLI